VADSAGLSTAFAGSACRRPPKPEPLAVLSKIIAQDMSLLLTGGRRAACPAAHRTRRHTGAAGRAGAEPLRRHGRAGLREDRGADRGAARALPPGRALHVQRGGGRAAARGLEAALHRHPGAPAARSGSLRCTSWALMGRALRCNEQSCERRASTSSAAPSVTATFLLRSQLPAGAGREPDRGHLVPKHSCPAASRWSPCCRPDPAWV